MQAHIAAHIPEVASNSPGFCRLPPLALCRHCIGRNSPSYVLLRTRNINSRRSPAEVIRVTKRIKHPQYDITGNVDNDAALLVLEKASKAAPVALAAAQFALKSTDKLLVAGWGAVSEDEDMSERLL